jgi:hypothetical protein
MIMAFGLAIALPFFIFEVRDEPLSCKIDVCEISLSASSKLLVLSELFTKKTGMTKFGPVVQQFERGIYVRPAIPMAVGIFGGLLMPGLLLAYAGWLVVSTKRVPKTFKD